MADAAKQTPARQLLTLAFILQDGQVLLGWKKRGFGKLRWNGFGGKVDPGEDITTAAVREISEECGLTVSTADMELIAVFLYEFQNDPVIRESHTYRCSKFTGTVHESEEMKPQWWSRDKLPIDKMWQDFALWLPWMLAGKKFRAHLLFDETRTDLLGYTFKGFDNEEVLLEKKKDGWTSQI